MNTKRVLICVLGGAVSAAFCLLGRQVIYRFSEVTMQTIANSVANRLLLGFVIGISCWRIDHLVHGAVLGFLFSLSVSIGYLPEGRIDFVVYTLAGTFYGVLIEWLATDLFSAPKGRGRARSPGIPAGMRQCPPFTQPATKRNHSREPRQSRGSLHNRT